MVCASTSTHIPTSLCWCHVVSDLPVVQKFDFGSTAGHSVSYATSRLSQEYPHKTLMMPVMFVFLSNSYCKYTNSCSHRGVFPYPVIAIYISRELHVLRQTPSSPGEFSSSESTIQQLPPVMYGNKFRIVWNCVTFSAPYDHYK